MNSKTAFVHRKIAEQHPEYTDQDVFAAMIAEHAISQQAIDECADAWGYGRDEQLALPVTPRRPPRTSGGG